MEKILNLYRKPLNPEEPVVCLDEKPVTLRQDARTSTSARPGRPSQQDYEYQRRGTANAYCIVEPKAGRHLVHVTPNRKKPQFAKTLKLISSKYPKARKIHLVMDNLSGHGKRALIEQYGVCEANKLWGRFQVHFTPKHGSWLNQAEIEISLFSRTCIGKNRIPDIAALRRRAMAWAMRMTRRRVQIHWRFTTQKARKVFHYKRTASLRPGD